MKQKDIALIIIIGFVSAVLAFLISNWMFGGKQAREQTAETIDVITAEFQPPPQKYFNVNAINPTKLIEIGGSSNPNPFENGSR